MSSRPHKDLLALVADVTKANAALQQHVDRRGVDIPPEQLKGISDLDWAVRNLVFLLAKV